MRNAIAPLIVCSLLATPALASTWVVDDDGGAGVDFTSISSAIAAASPGDVILILPGNYSQFTLSKSLALLASPGATVDGNTSTRILNLPAGTKTTLTGLTFGDNHDIRVEGCQGTVVLDELQFNPFGGQFSNGGVQVLNSSDVRMRALNFVGLHITSSRVEVSECVIGGSAGSTFGCPGGNGFDAVWANSTSRAHIYRSTITGGHGGTPNDTFNCDGGDAGHGINLAGARLLLAGDAVHEVLGGQGGSGVYSGYDGNALEFSAGGYARVSGMTVPGVTGPFSTLEIPIPRDPSMRILSQVGPGQILTFRVHTEPGATAQLLLGRKATIGPQLDASEVLLVEPLRTFQLGPAGPNGVTSLNFVVPTNLPTGFTYFGQAQVTLSGGAQRYTNSVPLIVL